MFQKMARKSLNFLKKNSLRAKVSKNESKESLPTTTEEPLPTTTEKPLPTKEPLPTCTEEITKENFNVSYEGKCL